MKDKMNILNGKPFEMFIFLCRFCEFLSAKIFHFVKSSTFAVKEGQEVGLKVGQKYG